MKHWTIFKLVLMVSCLSTIEPARTISYEVREAPISSEISASVDSSAVKVYNIGLVEAKIFRVRIVSNASALAPAFFTLRGNTQLESWKLPHGVVIGGVTRYSIEVCGLNETYSLQVSTSSSRPITFVLNVQPVIHNKLQLNQPITVTVFPQEAHYAHFVVPPTIKLFWLQVTAKEDSSSTIQKHYNHPLTETEVSLRAVTCDAGAGESFRDRLRQTMTTRASIAVYQSQLPNFDLVIYVPLPPNSKPGDEYNETIIAAYTTPRTFNIVLHPDETQMTWSVIGFFVISFAGALATLLICISPQCQPFLLYPKKESKKAKAVLLRRMSSRKVIVSGSFVYNLMIIAAFYMLPAIQLIMKFYESAFSSGNGDACYYNFLCAYPLGPFKTFNNFFSNIGYILCGAFFCIIVKKHSYRLHWRFIEVFYAMGVALILEGLLSAGYHICPTPTNFQFDTTFMYLIAGLCTYHLYQIRNPNHEEHPYKFYGIFAGAVGFVVICISTNPLSPWRYPLSMLYFLLSSFVGWYVNLSLYQQNAAVQPHPRCKYWISLIQGILTVGFVIVSTSALLRAPTIFPSILLYMFITNLFLFTLFYFILKVLNKELIVVAPVLCAIIDIILWIASLYFYADVVTKWTDTPAASRALNHSCIWMGFFDSHDVWHLGSAFSLLFSFLLLMTIDDGEETSEFREVVASVAETLDEAELKMKDKLKKIGTKKKM